MKLMHTLRLRLQRFGLDVTRFPGEQPMHHLVQQLREHGVTCVLDVGANDGSYARELRRFGYTGRIVSFEPTTVAFRRAEQSAARDLLWTVLPYALGSVSGTATINVAGNAGHSSSMLPMLDRHRRAAPDATYVGTEEVAQHVLDDLWDDLVEVDDVVCLKIDVQGYEQHVLDGTRQALASGRICGLQLEMSIEPLYEGGWLYDDVLHWAQEHRFTLSRIIPGFTDRRSGRMLQADALFFFNSESSGA
jgi:FkbM family methyltransferase